MHVAVLTAVFYLAVATVQGAAQSEAVEARLLADVEQVAPGEPFTVGVLFRVQPGWHIYWKNPGDAGLATEVRLELPEGFGVGPLQWPTPHVFEQAGDIRGYGYADELLLFAVVRPPKRLQPGESVRVRATASWLSCEKVCVPGDATLELRIPVHGDARPAHGDLFQTWRERLPRPRRLKGGPFDAKTVGGLVGDAPSGSYQIELRWNQTPQEVVWFPEPSDALLLEGVAVRTEKDRTSIAFDARPLPGKRPGRRAVLESVVGFRDAEGRWVGADLPERLRPAQPKRQAAAHR